MGGGGKIPYTVPDYKIYKIDGLKELEWTRDALAEKGLKDPWLRCVTSRFLFMTGPHNLICSVYCVCVSVTVCVKPQGQCLFYHVYSLTVG